MKVPEVANPRACKAEAGELQLRSVSREKKKRRRRKKKRRRKRGKGGGEGGGGRKGRVSLPGNGVDSLLRIPWGKDDLLSLVQSLGH